MCRTQELLLTERKQALPHKSAQIRSPVVSCFRKMDI